MDVDINSSDLAVIALGGNLPGAWPSVQEALAAALERVGRLGFQVLKTSRWWRSAAWPDPADPPFLNGVALARTSLTPEQAMATLHRVEDMFGRDRLALNAPRTLDLDLIALGPTVLDGPIVLPHPRAFERLFVMGPLAETLKAISLGAVFMGAMTYIGNAPNFMVFAIARDGGVKMPGFFGYIAWSAAILGPLFLVMSVIFVR
jgi:2-amino-4-hydroxy-6-hydroxymethyldihydropteridine diphosphokinase